jgi:hypothetical protein
MVACTHRRPCFLCGSLEHERNQCDNGMCFRCRKPGHQARDCKASLGELAKLKEKTVTHCLRCGRDGHNMTACTRSALTHTHLIWTDKGSPSVHLDNFSTPQNRAQSRLKRALIGSIFAPALHTALSVSSSPLSLSLSLSLPLSLSPSPSLPLPPSLSLSLPPSLSHSLSLCPAAQRVQPARPGAGAVLRVPAAGPPLLRQPPVRAHPAQLLQLRWGRPRGAGLPTAGAPVPGRRVRRQRLRARPAPAHGVLPLVRLCTSVWMLRYQSVDQM